MQPLPRGRNHGKKSTKSLLTIDSVGAGRLCAFPAVILIAGAFYITPTTCTTRSTIHDQTIKPYLPSTHKQPGHAIVPRHIELLPEM